MRIAEGQRKPVNRTVLTAVTDRRILVTTPNTDEHGAVRLPYEDIASISAGEPVLSVTTTEGVGLEWHGKPLPAGLAAHLHWIGGIRARMRTLSNDVELAAGTIRTHADNLDWDDGLAVYRESRDELDDLANDVFRTPVPESALAPELTETERTLETAHTRLFIERGRDRLELARQLIENGDYQQGRKVLRQVQADHQRARGLRAAIERADAFQFGTQRDLAEDIESLGWEIETVAAEPIRQAHEAKIAGQSAEDPREAVEHWEQAFEGYGRVLTLEWGSDKRNLAGGPETVRPELEHAATRLTDLHSSLADDCWNAGAEHQADGEQKAALQCCLDAQRHLERAHELAEEFAPDRVETIAPRLETMADAVLRMRHAEPAAEDPPADATPDSTEAAADEAPTPDEGLPSAEELAELDTHHEITLDSEPLGVQSSEDATPPEREVSEAEESDENADSADNEVRRH
ncbi:hypothetical protein [Halovenus halobia]|uniref:hypothetical protein n=1 Tax=Halovenus halobia TaxID=3396622 RepID=UPI003F553DC6